MIIETETRPLAEALKALDRCVDGRSTTMKDVLIRCGTEEQSLTIRNETFDLQRMYAFDTVDENDPEIDPELEQIAVNSRRLVALLDSIEAPLVRLEAKSTSVLTVKTGWESEGGGRYTIRNPETYLYDDEPTMPEIPWQFSVKAEIFSEALKRVRTAASADDYRYQGVWFHVKDATLRVFAIDGKRICFQEIADLVFDSDEGNKMEGAFQIPVGTANAIISLAEADGAIKVGFHLAKEEGSDESRLGKAWFGWDDTIISSKILEATMLVYKEILGLISGAYVLGVNPGEFSRAVKQASLIREPSAKRHQSIILAVEDGKLIVRSSNREGEAAEIQIECDANILGIPAKRVNPRLMLDIMPFMGEEALQIQFGDAPEGREAIIALVGGFDFQYGLMPMRMET